MEFSQIIKDLKAKKYQPVYFLFGEEEYFIDRISDYIEEHVLDSSEKEFNQTVLYGLETDVLSIVSAAKRYPMMAPYNVIIIKEAQNIKKWDALESYFKNPLDSTILVINHKFKKPDGRSKAIKAAKEHSVFFESKKLYEDKIVAWVEKFIQAKGYTIEPKATMLMVESIGLELTKLSNEIGKLSLNVKKGTLITPDIIEQNVGISKEYNVFELTDAISNRNILKANKIINHFGANEKSYPLPLVLPTIYRYFSQLLLFHTVKGADNRTKASVVGVNPYFLKSFEIGAKHYPVKKIARIISALRSADLQSKGVGSSSSSNLDILKELLFIILH
ncbi:MAG: DNA polymerase III subunit delta [Bacteroidetes bacterium]|nr:MAG: DNA polymerase III subunit delta [Bacteroidota bacterium]MBL1145171.1 DNA polymerase III subunit delta [Bacteroidota bacterium]NOG57967.1 DNA polymerase III subunit delta [Bacteroidota bacterium]